MVRQELHAVSIADYRLQVLTDCHTSATWRALGKQEVGPLTSTAYGELVPDYQAGDIQYT